MKAVIIILGLTAFVLGSCSKSKTCSCKDLDDNIIMEITEKSSSKKTMQKFEEDCKNRNDNAGNGSTIVCAIK